jgi:hypothetical protein
MLIASLFCCAKLLIAGRFHVRSPAAMLIKQVVSIAIILGFVYFIIQKWGDPATKRMLNDVISRIAALS